MPSVGFVEPGGRLVMDHCHSTGKPRGPLCDPHNSALGNFNDDPHLLISAVKHLGHSFEEATRIMAEVYGRATLKLVA
jgi:hypothetical protein